MGGQDHPGDRRRHRGARGRLSSKVVGRHSFAWQRGRCEREPLMTASTNTEIDFALRPSSSPIPAGDRERLLADPGFGQIFTDNMVTIRWSDDRGWHDGQLEPYGPITLEPATAVFHYAQEIFEGLKAYRQASGPIGGSPPPVTGAKLNRATRRMALRDLPEAALVRAIDL